MMRSPHKMPSNTFSCLPVGQRYLRSMVLNAFVIPAEEGGYVSFNPETGTTTQGETIEEAVANLKEATELYLEEVPDALPKGNQQRSPFLTVFEPELAHA